MNVTRLNYDGAEKLAEIRLLTLVNIQEYGNKKTFKDCITAVQIL